MKSKKKGKRKAEITFLLLTLLTLYPYMSSQPFRELGANYDSLSLI